MAKYNAPLFLAGTLATEAQPVKVKARTPDLAVGP
jgi:hypothetical protein